jgi:Domain of Unknown Function (DUF748)
LWKVWVTLLGVIIFLRLAVPLVATFAINRELGSGGKVAGVGLSLWRGACRLEGLEFRNKAGGESAPIFKCGSIDVGIHGSALFAGKIVATVAFINPEVNIFTDMKTKTAQLSVDPDWSQPIMALIPVQIGRLVVKNGEIHFRDPNEAPAVDVWIKDFNLTTGDLSAGGSPGEKQMTPVTATGKVMSSGTFEMHSSIDPFAHAPTFDSSTQVTGLALVDLNPLLKRYLGFEVGAGCVNIYSESAAADGKYKGSVKPMLIGLKVMKPHESLGTANLLKKTAAAIVGWFLTKTGKSKDALKYEYSGTFSNPKLNLWQATIFLYESGFMKAMRQNQ